MSTPGTNFLTRLPEIFSLHLFLVVLVASFGPAARADSSLAPEESPAFSAGFPDRYSAVSGVVMQYRWFKFPALGVLTVDASKRRFALVGMSQIGINVFELGDTGGRLECRMPGNLLKRHPQIAAGAAVDVRQMFFDLAPPAGATRLPDARGNTAVFHRQTSGGTMEYRYDKSTGHLLEKRFSVPRKLLPGSSVAWRITYGDYSAIGRCVYPRAIRFKQRNHHYAVAISLKELRITR